MPNTDILDFFKGLFQDEFLNKAFLLSIVTGGLTAIVLILKRFFTFIYARIKRLIVFSVRVEQTDELFWALETWLCSNHNKKYRNVIGYSGIPRDVYDDPKETGIDEDDPNTPPINMRQDEDFIIIRYKGNWININKGRDKLENASSMRNLFFDSFVLKSLFGTRNIQKLLDEVMEHSCINKKNQRINHLYTFDGYNYWNKQGRVRAKDTANIILPEHDKKHVLSDIQTFLNQSEWYGKRGVPYKRGYLFYGPPGNGKTSLALSLAKFTNRDIYPLNLSSIAGDKELIGAFNGISPHAILLLEDVDVMFKGKRKVNSKISFSTLLNCLDGAFYKDGVIIIMTTNYIEKLDAALIREGRIDVKLLIDNPTSDLMKEYINNFYEQEVYTNGDTVPMMNMATLQNVCLRSTDQTIKNNIQLCQKD